MPLSGEKKQQPGQHQDQHRRQERSPGTNFRQSGIYRSQIGKKGKQIEPLTVILITCADEAEAAKISKGLIENKLAACVNIFPVSSIFSWKGKIENQKEELLIAKSVKSKFSAIEKFVKKEHSYQCPEVIGIEANLISSQYAEWIRSTVNQNEE